jgi:uncharacterized iron-regulated membrane protein
MPIRKVFFWIHLAVGLAIGIIILSMSVTGTLLAFEPQITEWSERHVRSIAAPAPGAARVSLDTLLATARLELPGARPADIRLRPEASATVAVGFGKEKGSVHLDPYTGKVVGKDSKTHAFLYQVEQWHRWLGSKKIWKPVIDAVSLGFAFMVLSGIYLWWPRKWSRSALKSITVPDFKLAGKARDWNWHNAAGFWMAPLLLIIALTGTIIGYRWASDLVYVLSGNTPPPKPPAEKEAAGSKPGKERMGVSEGRSAHQDASGPKTAGLDSLLARAQGKIPVWSSIVLRLSQKPGAPVTAILTEPGFWRAYARSQLQLDPVTGGILKWEPYSGFNSGKKLRTWVVPIHTGRALGIPGQLLAAVAAFTAGLLVWTGLALSWRRFTRNRKRSRLLDKNATRASANPVARPPERRTSTTLNISE